MNVSLVCYLVDSKRMCCIKLLLIVRVNEYRSWGSLSHIVYMVGVGLHRNKSWGVGSSNHLSSLCCSWHTHELSFSNIGKKIEYGVYERVSRLSIGIYSANMTHPLTKMKQLRTPECYSYKPFQIYNWLY